MASHKRMITSDLFKIKKICYHKYNILTQKLLKHGYTIENSTEINENTWDTLIPRENIPLLQIKKDDEELIVFCKDKLTGEIFDLDLFLEDLKKELSVSTAYNIHNSIQKLYLEHTLPTKLMNLFKEHKTNKYAEVLKYIPNIRFTTWMIIAELLTKNNYFVPIDLVSTFYEPSYFDKSILMDLHTIKCRNFPFQIKYTLNGVTNDCSVDLLYLDGLYEIINYILSNKQAVRNNKVLDVLNLKHNKELA